LTKVKRKKNQTADSSIIPTALTRRHCVSKVAEIFDITGKVMPLISSMKLDLHTLVQRKLEWDDPIPEDLKSTWISNFSMMKSISTLRFKRTIIPPDAVSLDVDTLDFADASCSMACSAIYARIKRSNGMYSCQLVFARSKIIPEGTSQPRAELTAALLNAHTGEVVKRSFGKYHQSHVKLTDSEIVLHWITNEEKPLKQWVRNRVLEIRRFTNTEDWYHVDSKNMIADTGTRKGTLLEDVNQDSNWMNGFEWMTKDIIQMPIKAVNQLNLSHEDIAELKKETTCTYHGSINNNVHVIQSSLPEGIEERYQLSNYLVDPNKYRFEKVARIMAIVIKFVAAIRKNKNQNGKEIVKSGELIINDKDIKNGKDYFFRKATLEVKFFNKEKSYSKFTKEINGILLYTGRILPTDEITVVGRYTDAMKDLADINFCAPVIDKLSPLAYSIINEVHWYDNVVKHAGIESVWRNTLKIAYVIEGKSIVKNIRKSCQRCRYLSKKSIDVAMAPISEYNLVIAPAFYVSQVDLAGPFQAYSQHHKRTTVKVWMAVFCCCTTSTINIKIMEDYSSASFIRAFIRLSCEVGYPKVLLPDAGSQLMKSCQDMQFDYKTIQNEFYKDSKVEFKPCPVGGHNMHGRVERKIKEIKKSLEKGFQNDRLSILQWETVCAQIANSINDMPLALHNKVSDFEIMDLITPNRLKLGRNNDRSPEGTMKTTSDPDKFLKANSKIFNAWFETWLQSHLPSLMYQPKWFNTSYDIQVGDIVLFLKQDNVLCNKYQYGMVKSCTPDKDGRIRKVNVKYRNFNENVDRETQRAVRELVVIHCVNELDIIQELGEIGSKVNAKYVCSK